MSGEHKTGQSEDTRKLLHYSINAHNSSLQLPLSAPQKHKHDNCCNRASPLALTLQDIAGHKHDDSCHHVLLRGVRHNGAEAQRRGNTRPDDDLRPNDHQPGGQGGRQVRMAVWYRICLSNLISISLISTYTVWCTLEAPSLQWPASSLTIH